MTATKIVVEAAAAALLSASLFALPLGLAGWEVNEEWTTVDGGGEAGEHASVIVFFVEEVAPAPGQGPALDPQPAEAPAIDPPAPMADLGPDPTDKPDVESGSQILAQRPPTDPVAGPSALHQRLATRRAQAPLKPHHKMAATADTREASAPSAGGKKKRRTCQEADPRITATGDDQFSVKRDLIDRYTGDLEAAAKLAWVGWHRDPRGDIDGFKVKRIQCGSVLHQAGFRNGDVVRTVNGKPVTTIPQALIAYRKLRKKRQLKVELDRGGDRRELRYRLS